MVQLFGIIAKQDEGFASEERILSGNFAVVSYHEMVNEYFISLKK
jgi:hypothetical protein